MPNPDLENGQANTCTLYTNCRKMSFIFVNSVNSWNRRPPKATFRLAIYAKWNSSYRDTWNIRDILDVSELLEQSSTLFLTILSFFFSKFIAEVKMRTEQSVSAIRSVAFMTWLSFANLMLRGEPTRTLQCHQRSGIILCLRDSKDFVFWNI